MIIPGTRGAGKPGNKAPYLPLVNAKLRQAFALSLDRDAINKVVYEGQCVVSMLFSPSERNELTTTWRPSGVMLCSVTTGDHRDAGGIRARTAQRVPLLPVALATVLTVATGAMDAISFLRLGEVFTSIMTGNLVQLGLSAGRHDGQLATRAAFAVVAFVAGVVASSTIVGPPHPEQPGWPAKVNTALTGELVVLVGFLVGWAATDGRPGGAARTLLLAIAALAMGVQSGAVRAINAPRLSTTYLTGTLIGALATLITAGRVEWHSVVLLAAVVVGALGGGLLVINAPAVAPVLPVALLVGVLLTAVIESHLKARREG